MKMKTTADFRTADIFWNIHMNCVVAVRERLLEFVLVKLHNSSKFYDIGCDTSS